MGEVASSIPLIRALRADQPHIPVYLSTSTTAGRHAALRQAADLVDGIFYSPLDYVSCVRRCLRTIRPQLLVVLETEIWPNLYAEAKDAGTGIAIVNGRISARAWRRYRVWHWFFSKVLPLPDLVLVQSATDQARYTELGVPSQKLRVSANLKYDAAPLPSAPVNVPSFGADRIWIAASTVGPKERGSLHKHRIDEDDIVLTAFQALAADLPRLLLILAPRQPARFAEAARKLEAAKISFVRRTELKADPSRRLSLPGVLLLDTIGELATLYPLADAVFVGGSIAPRGGHNIIEPAAAGAPIVVGPHMHNFEAITGDFLEAGAMIQIGSEAGLLPVIRRLLTDRAAAEDLGRRAKQLVDSRRGTVHSIAGRLWGVYFCAGPASPRNLLSRWFLSALAKLWIKGGEWNRRRSLQQAYAVRPLPVPVISIGGITVGGSGKTPFTNYLAACLVRNGHAPAILTRGYRRRSAATNIILGPGAKMPAAFTGDEAQIYLRTGLVPVGIGANRYETAQILLRQFCTTDVLLLDDGFQHARLHRDFDIVLIDGLDPFGRGNVVPLGRLREPPEALARADLFVVTRAEDDVRFEAIRTRLAEWNPRAAVFRTRLVVRCWRDVNTDACLPTLAGRRVAAFCGLGNPENFWRTLESLGVNVVFRWTFGDHYCYKPAELKRLAHQARIHGADLLVTTEKDWVNCPDHAEKAIAPLDLAWLEIDLELEDEPRFLAELDSVLRKRNLAGRAS